MMEHLNQHSCILKVISLRLIRVTELYCNPSFLFVILISLTLSFYLHAFPEGKGGHINSCPEHLTEWLEPQGHLDFGSFWSVRSVMDTLCGRVFFPRSSWQNAWCHDNFLISFAHREELTAWWAGENPIRQISIKILSKACQTYQFTRLRDNRNCSCALIKKESNLSIFRVLN